MEPRLKCNSQKNAFEDITVDSLISACGPHV